jgi:hypothetical protein
LIGLDVIIMARSGDFKWETSGKCTSTLLNSCVGPYMVNLNIVQAHKKCARQVKDKCKTRRWDP